MSGLADIWSLLDIEPTSDIKKIKRAYAKQAAKYHPEEFPEKFQQIHQAYETALRLAKSEGLEPEEPEALPAITSETKDDAAWQEAQKVSELAEKYAKEEERRKVHTALYDAFLPDIALDRLDDFLKMRGIQPHRSWCGYIQEPVFLEALHHPDFLKRLTYRIGTLTFQKRTREQIKEVLEKEIPDKLKDWKLLNDVLNGKKLLSEKQRKEIRNRRLAPVWFGFLIVFLWVVSLHNSEEEEEIQKLHAVENLEIYIEEKYQIPCSVIETDATVFDGFHFVPDDEEEIDYYHVDTIESKGAPECFHLAWESDSTDYDDLKDTLEYETISMYAEEYGLLQRQGMSNTNVILIQDVPYEEFELLFIQFLHALRQSCYVQSGKTVEIEVQPGIMDYNGIKFVVEKECEINEEEVREKLKECVDRSLFYHLESE